MKLSERFNRIRDFIEEDLWRIRAKDQSFLRRVRVRLLRVVTLTVRGFGQDNCGLRASALTFFTLMSIVPVLALAFGVAKGFGMQETLRNMLLANIQGQDEVLTRIFDFTDRALDNTSGGLIAGFGVAILLYTVVKLLGNIEKSFNHIWGISRPRNVTNRIKDYIAFMVVVPFLFIAATSAMVALTSMSQDVVQQWTFLGPARDYLIEVVKWLPFISLWVLFTFIYLFMPNTNVHFVPALVAGLVTGLLYQLLQWVHIHAQVGVSKFNAIYGSFAALPLFLIWLQLSWMIVLLGVEVSYGLQHAERHEFEPDIRNASPRVRKLVALGIVQIVVERFRRQEKPISAEELVELLEAPTRLINSVLEELMDAKILVEVAPRGRRGAGYNPAQSPDNFTIQGVLDLLDRRGSERAPLKMTDAMERIAKRLESIHEEVETSEANVHLGQLYGRQLGGPEPPRGYLEGEPL